MSDPIAKRPAGANDGAWVSLAGRRVAYSTKDGPLTIDGKPDVPAKGAREISFSNDGKRIAYYARTEAGESLVVDGMVLCEVDRAGLIAPVFSPNGEHVACTARRGEAWSIFIDGVDRFGPFIDDQPGFNLDKFALRFTSRGLVYVATLGEGRMRIEVDGQPFGEAWRLIRDLVFTADESRFAYRARRDDRWWIVHDGGVLGPFESCAEPSFDGAQNLVFVAGDADGQSLFVNGAEVASYPRIYDVAVASEAAAYALIVSDAKRSKRKLVHGATESGWYTNMLGAKITPDGAHAAALPTKGSDDLVLVDGIVLARGAIPHFCHVLSPRGTIAFLVQGKVKSHVQLGAGPRSKQFDSLWTELAFDANDRVSFIAEQGDVMSYFELPVAGETAVTKRRSTPTSAARPGAKAKPVPKTKPVPTSKPAARSATRAKPVAKTKSVATSKPATKAKRTSAKAKPKSKR